MKYLFICSHGLNRSPTAASVMREIADQRGLTKLTADSIGITKPPQQSRIATKKFQSFSKILETISQYDRVFVMEEEMAVELRLVHNYRGEIINLDIEDKYEKNNPELRRTLREKLEPYAI